MAAVLQQVVVGVPIGAAIGEKQLLPRLDVTSCSDPHQCCTSVVGELTVGSDARPARVIDEPTDVSVSAGCIDT